MTKHEWKVPSMIAKFNAHAELHGWLCSAEVFMMVIVAIVFWYGIYIAIGSGSMMTAKFYMLPMPIYVVVRYFLHKAGKLRLPLIE